VVSSHQVFQPKYFKPFSYLPWMIHAPSISSSWIRGRVQYFVTRRSLLWVVSPSPNLKRRKTTPCRLSATAYSYLQVPSISGGRPNCMADVLMGLPRYTFSKPNTEFNSDLAPCYFWAFPTMKRELRGKKFRSHQWSAARFREVGGAL
jgi:hypothetical protein